MVVKTGAHELGTHTNTIKKIHRAKEPRAGRDLMHELSSINTKKRVKLDFEFVLDTETLFFFYPKTLNTFFKRTFPLLAVCLSMAFWICRGAALGRRCMCNAGWALISRASAGPSPKPGFPDRKPDTRPCPSSARLPVKCKLHGAPCVWTYTAQRNSHTDTFMSRVFSAPQHVLFLLSLS